jgi:two-component system, NarL family, response regulator DevR
MGSMRLDTTIRVFLLDDHELVRQGIRRVLESSDQIEVVGEADTIAQGTAQIAVLQPHVAVLDVRMPDGSGIEACRTIRSVDPTVKALMLTSYDDDEALLAAIMAGAAGYVLKEIRGTDLVDAVLRVAAGQSLIDPAVTTRLLDRVRSLNASNSELAALTPQETRLLGFIAEGLTNREIAERMSLAEKTVKNYVSSVLAKLGVGRRAQAAVIATRLLSKP